MTQGLSIFCAFFDFALILSTQLLDLSKQFSLLTRQPRTLLVEELEVDFRVLKIRFQLLHFARGVAFAVLLLLGFFQSRTGRRERLLQLLHLADEEAHVLLTGFANVGDFVLLFHKHLTRLSQRRRRSLARTLLQRLCLYLLLYGLLRRLRLDLLLALL